MPLRTVFMGTPAFGVPVLAALLEAGCRIVGVYARPDKPGGRGRRMTASPVKQLAQERGLLVRQPASLRQAEVQDELAALEPDVIVVAAYGLLLPSRTLQKPPLGCLNVHPSVLPRYRGPSPVASAILNGDARTGVTIIKLDQGMDTGPIVAVRETGIGPDENADSLTRRLFEMGAALLVEVLPEWEQGAIRAQPQDESEATITRRLTRSDGEIDWEQSAVRIARHVRAFYPWPGSFTYWKGRLLKVVEAVAVRHAADSPPGQVISLPDGSLGVAAGDGVLATRWLQLEGRRAVEAGEFAHGYPEIIGSRLGR